MEYVDSIDQEIDAINVQISMLQDKKKLLVKKRAAMLDKHAREEAMTLLPPLPDYASESFSWSTALRELARRHWHIDNFRPMQLPILNAALDRQRDLFVVLPTGAGKSLCYQLPALMESGFALIVTPLVSLIRDQVFHLEEAGISAAYLTAASTKEEVTRIQQAMPGDPFFKLLYVTPEKIAKSKRFMAKLGQAYEAGKLSRIVVDEAHCCSQQGHDFRPDYKQLNILRTLFPKAPIMALTATCPWKVMKDVMVILGMRQPHVKNGSLVYSAPLYRPNLVYSVLPKPEGQEETIQAMADWIITHYLGCSGIVYCLTKKDTHLVAQGLQKASKARIRCGVYHADMDDEDKEAIHTLWRQNKLQVIVATIAFGMGINHLQTRFIIHHTMSKSVEGYYQESGRAGRDGERAECVLFYRGQDAVRLLSVVVGEASGYANVNAMIRYAQDYRTCRKIFFERYFTLDPTNEPLSDEPHGLVNQVSPDTACGTCDNCRRSGGTSSSTQLVTEDVTAEAVTLVRLCRALKQVSERVTHLKLIQLWQGRGLKAAHIENVRQNKDMIIPVSQRFSKADLERIVNHLILKGYLSADFHFTPYNSIIYVVEGRRADWLHKFHLHDNTQDELRIHMDFLRDRNASAPSEPVRRKRQRTGDPVHPGNSAALAIQLDSSEDEEGEAVVSED